MNNNNHFCGNCCMNSTSAQKLTEWIVWVSSFDQPRSSYGMTWMSSWGCRSQILKKFQQHLIVDHGLSSCFPFKWPSLEGGSHWHTQLLWFLCPADFLWSHMLFREGSCSWLEVNTQGLRTIPILTAEDHNTTQRWPFFFAVEHWWEFRNHIRLRLEDH